MDILDPTRQFKPGAGTSEASVQAELRVCASKVGSALWRNNSGAVEATNGDGTTRMVRFGLGNDSARLSKHFKSSDLIGITPVQATHAGQIIGAFTAVEVKSPGWSGPKNEREAAQANFLSTVQGMGGIGMFAQSSQDYMRIFR
jgi:hypothetical protein